MHIENLQVTPFHIATLVIFILAIVHTLSAHFFTHLSDRIAARHPEKDRSTQFGVEVLYLLGEVEVIFGIWVVPLLIVTALFYDWKTAVDYIDSRNFIEPMFVVVIMTLAGTRPIVFLAERCLQKIAGLFGGGVRSSWFTILAIAPLLGSFITEPGAMTLAAMLLIRRFFIYEPSKSLSYATLGLLFVSISVGGALTNFAAPPVLIVSHSWGWSSLYMMTHFGWKVILGIFLSTAAYFFLFYKEFLLLSSKKGVVIEDKQASVPVWIICTHVAFLVVLVIHGCDPPIFIGGFLIFLGFYQATAYHQYSSNLKGPLLVGFFLAGLVVHGGLQGWWIVPILESLHEKMLMTMGVVLTAFNDNAAVVYLSSLTPHLTEKAKLAVVSGVLVGGGLTVIANAPNPAGQNLLRPYFRGGISPLFLFIAAFLPTSILYFIFYTTL